MPTTITTKTAIEKSTFVVTASFVDAAGVAAVPKSGLNWTLTNSSGTVINSRSSVVIAPAASVDIVLSGLDLAMQTGERGKVRRVLTIQGTYDSDEGTGLQINDECVFLLQNLLVVT